MSQETTNKAGGVSFIGLLGLVIGATIASAVFAFPGDFAAAGAGSGAVLVGWLIPASVCWGSAWPFIT